MGGLCSRRSTDDTVLSTALPHVNGRLSYGSGIIYQSRGLGVKEDNNTPTDVEVKDRELREPFSFPELSSVPPGSNFDDFNDGIPRLSRVSSDKSRSTRSKQVAMAKVSEVSSLLGRAGTVGLGKAVDVLDTLGSSMTNLNLSGGFASGIATKGIPISILAFEVANTVVKGANLMHSLSHENIRHLKEVVLPSEGVQRLISTNMDELLSIAESDKRDELKVFCGEVIRFGNRCKDPQWHNLDRFFEKLEMEPTPHKQLKEAAEADMQQLMMLVQYTAELYHEMHALDRFEQDCRRKAQEEENSSSAQREGDSLAILRAELKSQKKHVKSLKKKSLWSKILEEVMEKLVDIVHFLHLEIHSAFGSSDGNTPAKEHHQRLGSAGLSLHYANIINQIDTLVSSSEMSRQPAGPSPTDLLRIETLHHADREKTEAHILDLVVWLHHLISQSRAANGPRPKSPVKSPNRKSLQLSAHRPASPSSGLSVEDQLMLHGVSKQKLTPGISKSQEFDTSKTRLLCKNSRLSKSSNHSPTRESKRDPFPIRRPSSVPIINFDIDRIKALDVIDRVDTI
ncbi:hypothetical protein STAS_03182 [Striga asiatica]|uniref:DUF3475 domain-containing protein n=1 Tax=Striga asiatica TaxID=4170 RepID=A0A5A7P3U4_STRAF|nr:hypothetical protein STAS_03182 [Striga asiatica]